MCHWRESCDKRRHAEDHLSLVAGITRTQRRELNANGVETLTSLLDARLIAGDGAMFERFLAARRRMLQREQAKDRPAATAPKRP